MVKDHLLISRHEKIVVKLLAPGATCEATLKFSINYPGDMTVTSLN